MSYSIGPYMGKRDAVIRAVKKSVESLGPPMNSSGIANLSRQEAQRAVDFIVERLSAMPETAGCVARAFGSEYHADGKVQSQNHCVEIGQIGSYFQTPMYVE